jgi:hypothetical protein
MGACLALSQVFPANAADGQSEAIDLHAAAVEQALPADESVVQGISSSSGPRYEYTYESRCKAGEGCVRAERMCPAASGETGTWYVVIRTNVATGRSENLGIICLAPSDVPESRTITPAIVRREMQRLDWPTAQLEVQPPDGQTLINFETNFFTENTDPTTQTVTLLGQRVEIEATPSEYTWDFGDGTSTTTTSPGAAYPGLDVTHEYADPGRVAPSVDTTYTGRFRINGDAWQPIPGSLTVPGEAVALRVRSASPHLVGSY